MEYVLVPVTWAFTFAPCWIIRSMRPVFASPAASPAARVDPGREQERRKAHRVDVRIRPLGQKRLNHIPVVALGRAKQRRGSGVQLFLRKASAVAPAAGAMHIELRIGIDTGGQQGVDDLHAGNGGNTRCASRDAISASAPATSCTSAASAPPAGSGFFSIDSDVEGRAPPPIPQVGIRSPIQQQLGDIVISVVESDHQRSHAFRTRHIHISAGGDHLLDAVIAAVAGRIQQGGQASDGTKLRAGLRRNLVRPVAVERPRRYAGVFGQQAASPSRPRFWRAAAAYINGV